MENLNPSGEEEYKLDCKPCPPGDAMKLIFGSDESGRGTGVKLGSSSTSSCLLELLPLSTSFDFILPTRFVDCETSPASAVLMGLGVNSKVIEALLLLDTPNLNTSCGGAVDVTDTAGCKDGKNFAEVSAAALENREATEFSEELFSSFCSVFLVSEAV